ncbi:pyridoxal phosphate-dependent transferase [Trichophaea hybrida]|nr:pyridoxal phosphate-dependent transferase [Trichophaea hybrida]
MYPVHFSLENAIRPNVLATPAYITSTSDEVQQRSSILLDANENSLGSCLAPHSHKLQTNGHTTTATTVAMGFAESAALHRYPSASQSHLKRAIAAWKGLPGGFDIVDANRGFLRSWSWLGIGHICLGVGAADIIDLVIRIACTPTKDAIMITPPVFALYKVRAVLNEVDVVECPLETDEGKDIFQLRVPEASLHNPQVKVVFITSPGNPTGTLIPLSDIRCIVDFAGFCGLVVVDEAYIDFSDGVSAISLLNTYNNLIVIQTFSKTHGLAGIRLGTAFAHPSIIEMLQKVQMPYSISTPTSALALLSLSPAAIHAQRLAIAQTAAHRASLTIALAGLDTLGVGRPLDGGHANFVVLPILECGTGQRGNDRAHAVSMRLKEEWAVSVRYVGEMRGLQACLRITVGTEAENERLVEGLRAVLS